MVIIVIIIIISLFVQHIQQCFTLKAPKRNIKQCRKKTKKLIIKKSNTRWRKMITESKNITS